MVTKYPQHITLEEAWRLLESAFAGYARKFKTETDITEAAGHILTRDIKAERNVPHYAASAVDGYALRAADTAEASAATPARVKKGKYQWMNTGAALPDWADAVLMVEDSSLEGDELLIYRPLTPSANVRPLGEDVMAGQIIAREGEEVTPALISLFLCAGLEKVPVYRKAKSLFIPTGDEIIARGEWLARESQRSGTVAESNSLFIASSFKKWGCEVDVTPILPDDPELLKEYIQKGAAEYDVVMVGAGSAKGRRDHTTEVFEELGEVLFRGVRMKPGRPAMAACVGGKPVICLPGFPMSTAVTLWSLVLPLLKMLSGHKLGSEKEIIKEAIGTKYSLAAKLLVQHSSPQGIEEWLRVKTALVGKNLYGWALTSGASVLWALAEADGIAMLPASALECEKGTEIEIWMTRRVELQRRALFQGSDDPAIQLLVTPVRRRGADLALRAVGSMGGLAALSRGECHVAAAHLLDEESGGYNDIFIERFSNGRRWKRILVFYRTQGIIVPRGNPKGIKSFRDLCSGELVFSNRQPGAGTRVLFDHLLKSEGTAPEKIKGYSQICTTHMEAANRVYTGLADATLGIRSAADALGLDFIPLAEEPYELVIPEEHLRHPGIEALIESLSDAEWRKQVEEMGGYRWPN
ncbi:MAG: molybdopterin biosynthesis protein [Synergistaceae bacterium]|nr:molybdopterin biosynthesis protein [Synergistaceae bacterium]